ncbi:hypothetical protein ACFXK0_08020 [Nocardia sp. NPDC059177]|uniref:DUF7373 family lipoprotein n=1 Tax=Nocardia sp. NPDC059177 TaxID=3346759 RepID=UPI0036A8935B
MAVSAGLLVAACGGSPEQAGPVEPVIDIAGLDVGNYATTPRDLGLPDNAEQARFVEAERLGNYVPAPAEIDPALVYPNPYMPRVFIDPEGALGRIMAVDRFAEAAPGFIGGFISSAGNHPRNDGVDLLNAVMVFPDQQQAAAAASALERVDFEANTRNEPIEIPRYPDAHAHWQPQEQSIGVWYATGNLVIYTWVFDYLKIFLKKVDRPALIEWVHKSLDKVVPAVAGFRPTPSDQLMNAPVDLDGMLGRTLKRPLEDSWTNPPGAYEGRTAVHFSSEPDDVARTVAENGVDRYAFEGAEVYRARDYAAALRVQEDLGGLSRKFRKTDAPVNLPTALCKEYIGREPLAVRFYCSVTAGRYAAFTWASQLLDAQQRISAQYALLVNAR